MNKIIITQKDLDNLKIINVDDKVIIDAELKLNTTLKVFGTLIIKEKLISSFSNNYIEASGSASVEARGSASVKAWDSASVEAWDSASVEAWGSASVEASGSASVKAWGSASVKAWGSASVKAWDSASVKAWDSASVEAWGSASVKAWGSASVEAWDSASVEAWDSASVRLITKITSLIMLGFSVLIKDASIKMKFKKSKNVLVQNIKFTNFLEREMVNVKKGKVILFKRVSKDFKTQEDTINETSWIINSIVKHNSWNPENSECGKGKFHACSRPFFCDEFRSIRGDKYIAIEVLIKDLFEWKDNPQFIHKIAFRNCKVLYECDIDGNKI